MPTLLTARQQRAVTYDSAVRAIERQLTRLRQTRSAGVWYQGQADKMNVEFFSSLGALLAAIDEALPLLKSLAVPPSLEHGERVIWAALLGLASTRVIGQRVATVSTGDTGEAETPEDEDD